MGLSIPETHVFYSRKEAENFIHSTQYSLVAKTNIGAAGTGVKVLKTKKAAEKYIKCAFT